MTRVYSALLGFALFLLGSLLFGGCFLLLSTAVWPVTFVSVSASTLLGSWTFLMIFAHAQGDWR